MLLHLNHRLERTVIATAEIDSAVLFDQWHYVENDSLLLTFADLIALNVLAASQPEVDVYNHREEALVNMGPISNRSEFPHTSGS